jgi:hypothetical protein
VNPKEMFGEMISGFEEKDILMRKMCTLFRVIPVRYWSRKWTNKKVAGRLRAG